MARPGALYPQVDPQAAGLMDTRVLPCAPGVAASRALERAEGRGARALVVGPGAVVRREELSRAVRWGLHGIATGRLALRGLPVVTPRSGEVEVRRLLMAGAPMVVVSERGRVTGVIEPRPEDRAVPGLSIAHRLQPEHDAAGRASLGLCRLAGAMGDRLGVSVWAVGGFVRDVLLRRETVDLDLVVEGDGPAFARRLADEIDGRVVAHRAFGTASIEGARVAGGGALPRIDVATARREHYAAPGALPAVVPASLAEDLGRRDFSVNAMAMALAPAVFGRLVDPAGGRVDLERRRLRVLHPLSFVEDPTRVFRAARYSARLGLRLDPATRQALSLALTLGRFPALSGHRLVAELALVLAEPSGRHALPRLLRWQALRLWDPGFRASADTMRRLAGLRRLQRSADVAAVLPPPADAVLVALLLDQRPGVTRRSVARLAFTGSRAERLVGARTEGRRLARAVAGRGQRASAVARALRAARREDLLAAWLVGGRRARRRVRWFVARGHAVRPLMRAGDLLAAGVPGGPTVGGCLRALRDLRLDGRVRTLQGERRVVEKCRHRRKGGAE